MDQGRKDGPVTDPSEAYTPHGWRRGGGGTRPGVAVEPRGPSGPDATGGPDGPDEGTRLEVPLGSSPDAAARARSALAPMLEDVTDEQAGIVRLLTVELVANGVLHAGGRLHLTAHRTPTAITVGVVDGAPLVPIRRRRGVLGLSGRGLRLLDDLATAWGTASHRSGKVVWFRLDLDPPS